MSKWQRIDGEWICVESDADYEEIIDPVRIERTRWQRIDGEWVRVDDD